jgi:hypothetical protein
MARAAASITAAADSGAARAAENTSDNLRTAAGTNGAATR